MYKAKKRTVKKRKAKKVYATRKVVKRKVAKKKVVKKKVVKKKVVKKKVVRKVRCSAKTKNGKRCKRMVLPPAKYCYQHKNGTDDHGGKKK